MGRHTTCHHAWLARRLCHSKGGKGSEKHLGQGGLDQGLEEALQLVRVARRGQARRSVGEIRLLMAAHSPVGSPTKRSRSKRDPKSPLLNLTCALNRFIRAGQGTAGQGRAAGGSPVQ